MAYGRQRKKPVTPKERARIADLLDMDARGVIELRHGPWKYYGLDVGDPTAFMNKPIKDYAECLKPLPIYQTTI